MKFTLIALACVAATGWAVALVDARNAQAHADEKCLRAGIAYAKVVDGRVYCVFNGAAFPIEEKK